MLFIATPLYENKVSVQYMHGLIQTLSVLREHGINAQYSLLTGTQIAVNRERLVREFLKTNCPYFIFIDADMTFTPADILDLLASDVDIVSGLYRYRVPIKHDLPVHCFRYTNGKPVNTDKNAPALQECGFVPTGILLIKRTVFETLYKKHEYLFDQGFRDTLWFQKLFTGMPEDKILSEFEAEDVHFSKLCIDAGIKLYVKVAVRAGHIGEQIYKVT
jgi:hypothetical protein